MMTDSPDTAPTGAAAQPLNAIPGVVSFDEDAEPGSSPVVSAQKKNHEDSVRQGIAWVMLGSLLIIVCVGAVGWYQWGDDQDRMQTFGLIFGPFLTLIGTMIGFYFSKK